jgi:hypothetical protein
MRTSVPLTRATAKGDVAVQKQVGEPYRALHWFRDSILNENRDEVGAALKKPAR